MPSGTLVIINPTAGGGRAGRLWPRLEPLMYQHFGDLVVAITDHPNQVIEHLDKARAAGLTRIIAVGGDGTNHAIINAMLKLEQQDPDGPPMTFGQLPIGTGQDFSRSLRIPRKPEEAIIWLAGSGVKPIDLGVLEYDNARCHFLNIASAGISGDVDHMVAGRKRQPWTYLLATLRAFFHYTLPAVQVRVDGVDWYEGRAWLVAVANGAQFGRGMAIAPSASVYDGLFDVVLVKEAPRLRVLGAFGTVYTGEHLKREEVGLKQGRVVEIEALDTPVPLDIDGEPAQARHLRFTLRPGALRMLSQGGEA